MNCPKCKQDIYYSCEICKIHIYPTSFAMSWVIGKNILLSIYEEDENNYFIVECANLLDRSRQTIFSVSIEFTTLPSNENYYNDLFKELEKVYQNMCFL